MDMNDRAREIVKIFKKLKDLNLGISCFSEFDELRNIGNEYIRTGNSKKGTINIIGAKRIIVYNFGTEVDCYLKYEPTI
jgi:hypothetical protein